MSRGLHLQSNLKGFTSVLATGQTSQLHVFIRKCRGRLNRGLHEQSNPKGFTSVLVTGQTTRLPVILRKRRGRSIRGLHQQSNPQGFTSILVTGKLLDSLPFSGNAGEDRVDVYTNKEILRDSTLS